MCAWVCVCLRVHVCAHVHVYVCLHMCVSVCAHVRVSGACVYLSTCLHVCMCLCVHMCPHVCMHVQMSACACVHKHVPGCQPHGRAQQPPRRDSVIGACHLVGGQSAGDRGPAQGSGAEPSLPTGWSHLCWVE